MSGGERVGHRGVRGGGREEIRSRVGPTTDFSTTREKSACHSPVRNPGRASDVLRGALPLFIYVYICLSSCMHFVSYGFAVGDSYGLQCYTNHQIADLYIYINSR
jgi:hypothetical protein